MNRSDYAMSRKSLEHWLASAPKGARRAERVGNLDAREANGRGAREFRIERRDVSLTDAAEIRRLWSVEDGKGGQYAVVSLDSGFDEAERLRGEIEAAYKRGLERLPEPFRHAAPTMTM